MQGYLRTCRGLLNRIAKFERHVLDNEVVWIRLNGDNVTISHRFTMNRVLEPFKFQSWRRHDNQIHPPGSELSSDVIGLGRVGWKSLRYLRFWEANLHRLTHLKIPFRNNLTLSTLCRSCYGSYSVFVRYADRL